MKHKNRLYYFLIVIEAIVLFLLLMSYMIESRNTIVYSPVLQDWKSDVLNFNNGWEMSEDEFAGRGYSKGDNIEIVYSPFISVPKGDYTLKIDYECDTDQVFRLFSEGLVVGILPQKEEKLRSGESTGRYDYYFDGAVDDLEIEVCFNGIGNIHIRGITLVSGCWRPLENFIVFCILFFITDVLWLTYGRIHSEKKKSAFFAMLSSLALLVKPDYFDGYSVKDQLLGIFYNNKWLPVVFLVLFYLFYITVRSKTVSLLEDYRSRICIKLISVFIPLSLMLGYSFQKSDSWDLIFGSHLQIIKSYISFVGLSVFCYYSVGILYLWIDGLKFKPEKKYSGVLGKYLCNLRSHPFMITFITLFILSIPYMMLSYPALFVLGDTDDQIAQAFNISIHGDNDMERINQGLTLITQHHPVAHTLLMHVFILFGLNIIHSANIGLFLLSFLQSLVTIAIISYLVKTIVKKNASDRQIMSLIVFFSICPCIKNYLFLMSKDVLYGALTLLSLIILWKLINEIQCNKGTMVCYVLCMVGIQVMRNEGIYIILLQMLIYFFMFKRLRKLCIAVAISVSLLFIMLSKIVYPLNDFEPTGINEMLSIPIMQTARVLHFYPEDISEEDKAAIDGMWDYNELADNYGYDISDSAKGTFRKDCNRDDMLRYFVTWGKMAFRYPEEYIQATINNYYNYFYPGERQATMISYRAGTEAMSRLNEAFSKNSIQGMNLHYPGRFTKIRTLYESIRDIIFGMPFISLIVSVGFYTLSLLLMVLYWLRLRNKEAIAIFIPLLIILLVCLAGPCNGEYFRYYYPIVLCLPAAISLTFLK